MKVVLLLGNKKTPMLYKRIAPVFLGRGCRNGWLHAHCFKVVQIVLKSAINA